MNESVLLSKKFKHVISLSIRNLTIESSSQQFGNPKNINYQFYDVFFALKTSSNDSNPFYISEVIQNSLNPDFPDLNLLSYLYKHSSSYHILRQLRQFHLTVFIKPSEQTPWKKLIDRTIKLSSLRYVASSLSQFASLAERETVNERNNVILIILEDGVYEIPMVTKTRIESGFIPKYVELTMTTDSESFSVPMISYESAMKLNNLQLCILDIRKIQSQLTRNIDSVLRSKHKTSSFDTSNLSEVLSQTKIANIKLTSSNKAVEILKKSVQIAQNRLQQKKKTLQRLRLIVDDDDTQQAKQSDDLDTIDNESEERVDKIKFEFVGIRKHNSSIISSVETKLETLKAIYESNLKKLEKSQQLIDIETARIFQTLLSIFNIIPNPKNPIEFTVLELKLSNLCHFIRYPKYSHHHDHLKDEEENFAILSKNDLQIEIDTALGYVVQLVELTSLYLMVPLKYPVIRFGSYSFICDYVSKLNSNNKVFPLYLSSSSAGFGSGSSRTILFKFEYGISLLNKNIEQLMTSQQLTVPDPYNILGNLKMLMLYLASKDLPYK